MTNLYSKQVLLISIPVLLSAGILLTIFSAEKNTQQTAQTSEEIETDYDDTSRDAEGDTYSIVAYDKTTGQVGGAGCSCVSISGGIDFLSELITDGTTNSDNIVGAIHSQASYNASTQAFARNRMLAGDTPQEIIDATVAADGGSASRQYGVVGVDQPGAAGFTGSSNGNYANDIQIDNAEFTVSIQGNILDTSTSGGRDDILNDMRDAFLNAEGSLADRLMAAMQGAKRVGGDNRCQGRGNSGRTAFVQVLSPGETSPSLFYTTGNAVVDFIEPIDRLQCIYDSGEGAPFCRTTIDTFPYVMDFETKSWEQETVTCNVNSSWIRSRFATPTSGTGPSGANQGALYAFVESENISGQGFNRRAVIGSPCFDIPVDENLQLTFDYHMNGATMGTLNVTINDGSGWTTLWTRSGSQGTDWNAASIDLSAYSGSFVKLRFDATTGNGNTSDMAIDNVRLAEPVPVTCSTTIDSFPYTESFESGIGVWEQASGDDGNWLENTGGTPSTGTGPDAANDGTTYLYIEASSNGTTGEIGANAQAILVSPCFDLSSQAGAQFEFDYHTLGDNIGTIVVQASTIEGNWVTLFTTPGVSQNLWITETIDLSGYTENVKLRILGNTGSDFSSDLAIDNVRVTTGCTGVTKTWNGSTWSPTGAPDTTNPVIINGTYNTSVNGDLEACSVTVSTGTTLTIAGDDYVLVNGDIVVDGSLLISHTGNLAQVDRDAVVTNNGTINVDVTTPVLQTRDFMVMGSPMDGETRNDVFDSAFLVLNSTPGNFLPHPEVPTGGTNFADDNGDFWNSYSGAINVGEGYIVRPQSGYTDPANTTYDMTYSLGTLNNGDVTRPIVFNGLATNPSGTPNVLANPYASAIDADQLIADNALIGEVYFWEHLTPPSSSIPGAGSINFSMGDISMYNTSMALPAANDPGTTTTPNGVIATAQGFGIKAQAAGDVTFSNSMRLTSGNTTLRNPEGVDKLTLRVFHQEYGIGSYAGIAFNPTASEGWDVGYDTQRLATAISLFSQLQDGKEQLAIQTLPSFESGMKIPMGFASQVTADTAYTITIADIAGDNLSQASVYLIDNVLNTITDLTQGDYTFRSNEGTFEGRFTLQFEYEVLGTNDLNQGAFTLYPNPTKDLVTISATTPITQVAIYDLQGRLVQTHMGQATRQLTVTTDKLTAAMYFVTVTTQEGTLTKRLVKQ